MVYAYCVTVKVTIDVFVVSARVQQINLKPGGSAGL